MEEKREKRINLTKLIELKQEESRKQAELTKLPEDFYEGVKKYVEDFVKSINIVGDNKSLEILEQLSNLRNKLSIYLSVYDSLIKIRLKKVINKVIISIEHGNPEYIDKSNFTEIEKELFWDLYNIIKKYYLSLKSFALVEDENKILEEEVKNDEKEEVEEEKKEEKKEEVKEKINMPKFDGEVRIGRVIKDIGKFIWKDKSVYGPLEKEDIIIFPKDILETLSNGNVVKKIFVNEYY